MASVASPRVRGLISLCRYKSYVLASVERGTKIAVSTTDNGMSLMAKTKDVFFWGPTQKFRKLDEPGNKAWGEVLVGEVADSPPTAPFGV